MIVAFDNTFLTLALYPKALPRPNPQTGKPVSHCRERIEALIDQLSKGGATVVIPAPSLAEALCATPDLQKIVALIESQRVFEIAGFDGRAACEYAEITRKAIGDGDKRSGVAADWQVVKFDRQIVSIAKARGATTLFTDDSPQTRFAEMAGLNVVHTWNLPLPDEYAQQDWIKDGPNEQSKAGMTAVETTDPAQGKDGDKPAE